MKPKEIVERGYDRIHQFYHEKRMAEFWSTTRELNSFVERLPEEGVVLDAGCGSGYVSALLENGGFHVTGIDISKKMLALAKKNAPRSRFIRMDMTDLKLPSKSFDGVICLFSIIHVPRRSHLGVLRSFRRVLKPGGILAIHLGWGDYVGTETDWLGSGATLYWSHFDKQTNLSLLGKAGFCVLSAWPSKQKDGTQHLFAIAQPQGELGRRTDLTL